MLTKNTDIDDELVDGAPRKIKGFQYCNKRVEVVCIEFNDDSVARNLMESHEVSTRITGLQQNDMKYHLV